MGEKTKVCVIGSNSFSGADFIDLLLQEGRFTVLGVSRSQPKASVFLPPSLRTSKNYSFFQCDLNTGLSQLVEQLDVFTPKYIVNFAAQSEVAPSWKHPQHWYQTNVVALTGLANELKEKSYLKRYVHISSPEVYGTCTGVVTEQAPLNPSTPYAASKASGDLSLATYHKNFGFPLVTVRATNVYGARQQLFKIIPRSAIYLKSGRLIELHGGGRAVKSYIHIRDVSRGELSVMEHGAPGEIYHLSPKSGSVVREIVEEICSLLGKDFSDSTREVEERLGQDATYVIDSSKAHSQLAWEPKVSMREGLKEVVDWVAKEFEAIKREPLEYIHKV